MDSRVPARIDRATFDRVLQRAAELQAASKDIGDGLSEEEILALGTEVGIPAAHLRQALLEERTRVMANRSDTLLDRWLGRAEVSAERVVQGNEESIAKSITQWLNYHERFVVQRGAPGRMTYEPMDPLAGTMRRVGAMFDPARARPYLGKVQLVSAVITPLEPGFCHVTLIAAAPKARSGLMIGGSVLGGAGVAMGGVGILIGAAIAVGVVPAVVLGTAGWFVARSFREQRRRMQLGLERALDELERNPSVPAGRVPPPAGRVARGVGQVVREIGDEVRRALEP